MKKVLIPLCAMFALFCSFTTTTTGPENPKVGKRSAEKFMLGFEIYRADQTALNHADIKIEIYDHTTQKTIFKRDYTEMPTNKYSSVTYFENMTYGNDLTLLIQAPNYFAKEINISYDPSCTLKTKFCVNGLNNPPYEINGDYADRFIFPISLDSITIGEEMVIPNIYYKYNSAELQPRSFWILDSLSKVIEHNPEISIELGGHADALGGVACGNKDLIKMVYHYREINGATLAPMDAYSFIRGMKTLSLRVERQNQSALTIARWLDKHPAIEHVNYPGLESHPHHDVAKEQMKGFGGMLSFSVKGGLEAIKVFLPKLQYAHMAANLGCVETVVGPPVTTSHVECTAEERAAAGIPEGLVRYSTGIEDIDDLIADLEQALSFI